MKHFFKQGWAVAILVILLPIAAGLISSLDSGTVQAAETAKQKATRWVNEFDQDCGTFKVSSSNSASTQDKRCQALRNGLINEPISCSSSIVTRTGGGARFSNYAINKGVLGTCKETIKKMKDDSKTSAASQAAEDSDVCKSKSGGEKTDCIKGFVGGYNNEEKSIVCPDGIAHKASCEAGFDAGAEASPIGATPAGAKTEDIPCIGGPMGWILCPIINYMADGIVAIASFMDSMLQFKLLIGTDSGTQIRDAVGSFAAVGNIILVIAFLIIIFSQTTSLGLSNYGIKRMMPRVVIAAILINLSFYICALAIDMSNITGNAIMGFITGQGASNVTITKGLSDATQLSGPGAVQGAFGTVMAAAIGVLLLVLFLGPLALGMFITFIILVGRQVILLFLVLTAPLAFAAWLLPNTESWFKKWKDLFISMLVVYPMLMAIFGVALFAAKFLSQIAQTSSTADSGIVAGNTIGPLIVLLVLAIPLLALPFILKQSNAMLGKIGAAAQKYGGQQASGKLGSGIKKAPLVRSGFEMAEQRKATREQAYNKVKAKRGANRARGVRGAMIYGGLPGKTTQAARAGIEGQAAGVLQGLEKQEIENARAVMQNDKDYARDSNSVAMKALKIAHENGDEIGVRAATAELSSNAWGVKNLQSYIHEQETSPDGSMSDEQRSNLARGINDNWTAFKSKDASVSTWSTKNNGVDEKGKPTTIDAIGADGSTYSGLKADELSTQTDEALVRAMGSEYQTKDENDQTVTRQGVAPETAQAVLDSSDTQKNLTGVTRPMFEGRKGGSPPSGGGGYTPPPGSSSAGGN